MKASLFILFAVLTGIAAGQDCAVAPGRAYYYDGQFPKAAAYFEFALRDSPEDPALHYWAGRAHEVLADIAAPLGHKHRSKARTHLARAVELAPENSEYRRELFHFLLDSGDARQAAAVLHAVDEPDPEYAMMRRELERGRHSNTSAENRLGQVFLAAPRAAYRVVEAPLR